MGQYVSASDQPAAATAAVATLANGKNYRIDGLMAWWSYDTTPTGGKLTIKRGTTTLLELTIPAAGAGSTSLEGLQTAKDETLSATLASGAGTVVGKVGISGKYR